MALKISGASNLKSKIYFNYSPLSEIFFSLNVLYDPSHHIPHHDWASIVKEKLDISMKETINFWGTFNEWFFGPAFLAKENLLFEESLEEAFKSLETIPSENLINQIFQMVGVDFKSHIKNIDIDKILNQLEEETNLEYYRELLLNPEQKKKELVEFLKKYWEEIYKDYFLEISLKLLKKIQELANKLQNTSSPDFFTSLSQKFTYNPANDELQINVWLNLYFDSSEIKKIVLTPTSYGHLMVSCQKDILYIWFTLPWEKGGKVLSEIKKRQEEVYLGFKTLGDKTRLEILELLAQKPLCNSELAEELNLTRATISQHLNILRTMNIIEGEQEKNKIYYQINLERIKQLFSDFYNIVRNRSNLD